jgi:hypothetical protein
MTRYTLAELSALPTLSQGQADDLKIDTGTDRVWLSRMTVADGMPYDNQVTEEYFNQETGAWETLAQYMAE